MGSESECLLSVVTHNSLRGLLAGLKSMVHRAEWACHIQTHYLEPGNVDNPKGNVKQALGTG